MVIVVVVAVDVVVVAVVAVDVVAVVVVALDVAAVLRFCLFSVKQRLVKQSPVTYLLLICKRPNGFLLC